MRPSDKKGLFMLICDNDSLTKLHFDIDTDIHLPIYTYNFDLKIC